MALLTYSLVTFFAQNMMFTTCLLQRGYTIVLAPRSLISVTSAPVCDRYETGKCEYFKYLDSMMINDARCTRVITSIITMAKAALKRKRTVLTSRWSRI